MPVGYLSNISKEKYELLFWLITSKRPLILKFPLEGGKGLSYKVRSSIQNYPSEVQAARAVVLQINFPDHLIVVDYDSSDTNNKDVVNKKYVDSKAFTLDVSKGLDMKGNKVINVADPTRATDGSNERHGDTKASNYLKTDGTRVMTANLKMNNRSIINAKQA